MVRWVQCRLALPWRHITGGHPFATETLSGSVSVHVASGVLSRFASGFAEFVGERLGSRGEALLRLLLGIQTISMHHIPARPSLSM